MQLFLLFGPSGLQFQKEYPASGKGYNDNGEESSQIAAKNAIVQLTEIGLSLYSHEGLRCVTRSKGKGKTEDLL